MPTPIKGLPHVGDSWRNTETDESGTVVGYAPDVPYMGDDGKLYPTTSPVVKYDSGETLFGVTPQYTLPEITTTGHLKTPADDLDKVMLGTLAAGVAPMALPEIVSGATAALANPYVDAALTSYFGAHGINDIANGNANAMTALEILPMTRLAKPLWNAGKNTLKHASNTTDSTSQITSLEDTVSPKSLRITAENAASITPEQWTAAQDAAIARGDMVEAQRLSDLHADINGYNSSLPLYHGSSEKNITTFDPYAEANTWEGSGGTTFFTPAYEAADTYAKMKGIYDMTYDPGKVYKVYSAHKNPKIVDYDGASYLGTGIRGIINSGGKDYNILNSAGGKYLPDLNRAFLYDKLPIEGFEYPRYYASPYNKHVTWTEEKVAGSSSEEVAKAMDDGYDVAILKNIDEGIGPNKAKIGPIDDYAIKDPGLVKFSDAVTYDDNGVRIPLGERHNRNIKDSRWGILGPVAGAAGYGLYDNFNSTNSDIHAYGGPLHKRWNDLSIKEKRDMMKVAISNGITNLSDIKDKYNEFAEGGYTDWSRKMARYKGLNLNDRSYDYESYYKDNTAEAESMLKDNPEAHFPDTYKTIYHPTFSNQSKYSGQYHPIYNPNALTGGTWSDNTFVLPADYKRHPVSGDDILNYVIDNEEEGVNVVMPDGKNLLLDDGTQFGGVFPNVVIEGKKHGEGGNLYSGGGYVYDILPQLFAMDGVPVTVTSGYRPGARVQGTNRLSRHARHEAVDLRGDFARMQQVLNNPNSNVARWMLANGYGYLNEAPTFGGTTKYWPKKYFRPDGTPDFHDHFHIGKDYGSKYAASFRGVPQQQQPRAMYTGMGWRNIAADNIMRHEGFMQHSYADAPKGKSWRSIGYGFNDSGFYNKYPMGISKYYDARGGITRAEAQQELNYMLDNMERQARAAYGSRWDQFNDNQKAAIMDTMYQRPASVLKGSQFHRAVMAGDPNAVNYLGVSGFDKRNADRRGLFGSPTQYAMQMPMQQPMQQMDQFAGWEPSNPQAFYGQGNSAIDREMAEKMANMEATMKAYQEAQEQQQLAAARQAERQEKAARANLAWNFVMGMNGDNQQQSPYMGLLGALSSNAIMGEE